MVHRIVTQSVKTLCYANYASKSRAICPQCFYVLKCSYKATVTDYDFELNMSMIHAQIKTHIYPYSKLIGGS